MKVTIVCEHNLTTESEGRKVYPEGMDNCIADFLRKAGNEVTVVAIGENGAENLTDEILENTEVMFWWGHWYHDKVSEELTEKVVNRVQRGMGIVFLHSAHMSRPFRRLMGTSCTLKWREASELERLWCVDLTHPIARGLGEFVDIPHEEMYGEPFDIPTPEELVYIGWYRGGEVFRGGCVYKRGRGKVFYFNPGHETYPTYKLPAVQQLLTQACEYVAPVLPIADGLGCPNVSKFSIES